MSRNKSQPNVAFLTMERYQGRKIDSVGSSRIRMRNLFKYWPEAEEFIMGKPYDVLILQKVYWKDYVKTFKGIKILDMCDPDWFEARHPIVECLQYIDAITTSTVELAKFWAQVTDKPVWYIPDRLVLEDKKPIKNHKGQGDAKTCAWYGYGNNFGALDSAILSLIKYKLNLIVISNEIYTSNLDLAEKINLVNYPWSINTVDDDLLKADIVLNPTLNTGKWKYKSNNKTINAWALGLPVAHNSEELKRFIKEDERIKAAKEGLEEVRKYYDIRSSVSDYKALIEEIKKNKV